MKIIEKDFNIETGQETLNERIETATESKARLAFESDQAEQEVSRAAAESAKLAAQAKLTVLGLTTDDLKALGL